MRIDKYLWSIRVYKTRSQATLACKSGKVRIGGTPVKAAYEVKVRQRIEVRFLSIYKIYEVKGFPPSRLGASKVAEYVEDQTPAAEWEKLQLRKLEQNPARKKGSGRPAKKEWRDLQRFFNTD